MTGRTRRRDGGGRLEAGVASLELVILAPALFVLLFLGAQFALWYYAGSVATTAARDGANAGAANLASGSAAYTRANTIVSGPGAGILQATISVSATGQTVTVKIDGTAVSILPGISLPVHATAATPVETFQPQAP